jgi:two-component system, cell cycle sensor histidine kinase and response regulator CckA
VLLHAVGRHYFDDIERLRQHDRAQTLALEAALAETRRQLADRERTEAERAAMETDRRQLEEQLLQAQKMEALGTLAGGFAHDMNNVLGGILAGAELLREDAPAALRQDLDDLITATQRGAELTRNLLGFARRGQYRKEVVDIAAVVTSMIRLLQRTVPRGVVFESIFEEPTPTIEADPGMLTQALVNLCLNAVDAMRGVGRLKIVVRSVEVEAVRYASIAVSDTGSGMDADTQQRIFEPFFTTKQLGRGTGLGLAMVYGTVKSWNGTIEVDSTVGVGTTMTLRLPASAARDVAKPKRNSAAMRVGAGTILIVDDDARIRKVARRVLETRGYTILEACDGAEGVATYEQHREAIQLVILDMAMPVMAGASCFRALRERDPEVRVLLASGYALEDDARRCLSEGALGFIDKPYTVEVFTAAVNRAIRGELVSSAME